MKIIEKIKSLFKRKEVKTIETELKIRPEINRDTMFTCHHCGNQFVVIIDMTFKTKVKLINKDEYIPAIGITCPKCKKESIYG